jgi:hypothetical protein
MGFFSFLIFGIVPTVGACTVLAFRLGQELPKASRKAGRSIGMGYNYMKIIIKHFTPHSEQGVEIVRKARQAGQQAFAFSNEVKMGLVDTSPLIQQAFPGITEDPFKKFGIQVEKKVENKGELNKVLLKVFEERGKILEMKKKRGNEEETLMKF